ncbi:hypothetical protein DY000_02022941 [Brassica cretica]|uniref:Uncharacterized protein n=1 Tax=Brassica cretica TaxID=69181 RepID=A0ABQ7EL87_BRACR|nr:hypothetical protein DY000_02022941 [Brassica cretica]
MIILYRIWLDNKNGKIPRPPKLVLVLSCCVKFSVYLAPFDLALLIYAPKAIQAEETIVAHGRQGWAWPPIWRRDGVWPLCRRRDGVAAVWAARRIVAAVWAARRIVAAVWAARWVVAAVWATRQSVAAMWAARRVMDAVWMERQAWPPCGRRDGRGRRVGDETGMAAVWAGRRVMDARWEQGAERGVVTLTKNP